MRILKIAFALLFLIVCTTCGGGGGSDVTGPKITTCDPAFGGDMRWIISKCGALVTGVSKGQLSTTNGCRTTLDVTPDTLKAQGQIYTMVIAWDKSTATLERKGTVCDAIDNGTINDVSGHTYSFQFRSTPTGGKCCDNDYFITVSY